MNLKEIFIKSFRFLVFDWRFFAIVLAFYVFQGFLFDVFLKMSDSIIGSFMLTFLTVFWYSLFWVIFAPFVIYASREFFTKQQKIVFNIDLAKKYIAPLFAYQLILLFLAILSTSHRPVLSFIDVLLLFKSIYFIIGFLMLFTPAIIVLENEKFFIAVKKSIDMIRNNFKAGVIPYLILIVISILSNPAISEDILYMPEGIFLFNSKHPR